MDHEAILADFEQRMPPSRADKYLGIKNGTIAAAIKRGEIQPYRLSCEPDRCYVTPMILAEWLDDFCRGREQGN